MTQTHSPFATPPSARGPKLPVASLEGASKIYNSAGTEVVALRPTTVAINSNELTLILGPSGSGKTTLISLLGCVIYPTQGKVKLGDEYTQGLNEKQLAKLRLQKIGFVFQSFNLIAPITVLDNVMLPLRLQGVPDREGRPRAEAMLERLGMIDKRRQLPRNLSGGQQQRVAIARALVTEAPLMLCDEPTASLDSVTAEKVIGELKHIAYSNRAVAIVTHDLRLTGLADRVIYVTNGEASETPPPAEVFH